MKKLILILAVLFSFNGWAEEVVLKCTPKRNATKTVVVVIDKQAKTFTVDGKRMKLKTTNDFYKAGEPLLLSYQLNRVSLELTTVAMGSVITRSCKRTERI